MKEDTRTIPTSSIAPEHLGRIVNAVKEDPDLRPEEKETTLCESSTDGTAQVFSEQAGPVRRLLRHSEFEIEWVRVYHETARSETVAPEDYSEGLVTGVKGYLPIGCLKVQSGCRTNSSPCKIVSKAALLDIGDEGDRR
jgi:hypothetical protein